MSPAKRDPGKPAADIAKLLVDIANLNLNEHQIPGGKKLDKSPPPQAVKTSTKGAQGPENIKPEEKPAVIISSDNEGSKPKRMALRTARSSKVAILSRLTREISEAINNHMLAKVLHEFIELLESNRSKMLTREGFTFLDTFYKQLADPSIFIVNSRSGRPARPRAAKKTSARSDIDRSSAKGSELKVLRKEIKDAPLAISNSQMAQMIREFETVIKQTSGHYVNADGLAFLQGVEARLKD